MYFINKRKRRTQLNLTKNTQLTEINRATGCVRLQRKQQTAVEEQEVGYSASWIHDIWWLHNSWWKKQIWKKKSPLDQIQQNILDLALQVCSYWLLCDDRQVPLLLHGYHCFVQTLLQGSEFQAQVLEPLVGEPVRPRHWLAVILTPAKNKNTDHMWWADGSKQIE